MVTPTKVWRDQSADRVGDNRDRVRDSTGNNTTLTNPTSKSLDGNQSNGLIVNGSTGNGLLLNGMRMLPTSCGTRRCGVHDTVDALGCVGGLKSKKKSQTLGQTVQTLPLSCAARRGAGLNRPLGVNNLRRVLA